MSARQQILDSLRRSLQGTTPLAEPFDATRVDQPWRFPDQSARVQRLQTLMQAVQTEVHLTTQAAWTELLAKILVEQNIPQLLIAPSTALGQQIEQHFQQAQVAVELVAYQRPIEQWKQQLFDEVPASFTGTLGAIAATGSLIVQPSPAEPRLMSLVPPVHIAYLAASQIYDNLYQAQQHWPRPMPSNMLLISGPSKTADIEQVLAYGAHGPKQLIVLVVEDQ